MRVSLCGVAYRPWAKERVATMGKLSRFRPSPAMVVALIALFVALGGGAYAGVTLNSIHSQQIKNGQVKNVDLANNAVNSAKIRRGGVTDSDLAPGISGSKITGKVGAAGVADSATTAGSAAAAANADRLDGLDSLDLKARWAHIDADGVILAQSGGITVVDTPATGTYIVNFGVPTTGRALIVSSSGKNESTRGTTDATPCGGAPEGVDCPNSVSNTHVRVRSTRRGDDVLQDNAFYLILLP